MPNARMKKTPAVCCAVRILSKKPLAKSRIAASTRITTRNALERFILTVSPCTSSRVVSSSGQASAIAPIRNAIPAHDHGTRKAGSKNIEKPVAIPRGGKMIFRSETAVRASRSRHMMMTTAPAPAARTDPAAFAKKEGMWGSASIAPFYSSRTTSENPPQPT